MSYSDKLKDPRWQKKRLEVMERAGFACQLCGDESSALEVHHPRYIEGREPWEYSNLICLCEKCHGKHHGVSKPAPYIDPLWFLIRRDAAAGNRDAIALLPIIKHPEFSA